MTMYTALTTLPGRDAAEALGEALEALDPTPTGVGVFEIEDGRGLWEVGGYFTESPDDIGLALLAAAHGAAAFAVSRVEDRDWVAQVRRELHPVHAGRFTVYGAHDAHVVGPERIGLRIEAAMAFGTGHHATTHSCLTLFDRLLRVGDRPARVADVGCGTGVLAMAAARACRAECVATDIDPVAVDTARANTAVNGVAPLIRTAAAIGTRHDLYRRGAFDLVFANILARPLRRLAPEIASILRPGGHAILAGILENQIIGVEGVFAGHGMTVVDRVRRDGWTSVMVRRSTPLSVRGRH